MLFFTIWPMALAFVFMVIIPLCAAGVIPSNRFVGIRWPVLRASEEAWQRGHRAAIPATFVGGIGAIVSGIALSLIPNSGALAPIVAFIFLLAGFGVASLRAQKAAV